VLQVELSPWISITHRLKGQFPLHPGHPFLAESPPWVVVSLLIVSQMMDDSSFGRTMHGVRTAGATVHTGRSVSPGPTLQWVPDLIGVVSPRGFEPLFSRRERDVLGLLDDGDAFQHLSRVSFTLSVSLLPYVCAGPPWVCVNFLAPSSPDRSPR
jgi:hypothetical protein